MSAELKQVIEQLGHAHEEFKKSVEQQLAEVKSGRGQEAVLNDKVERLNAALNDLDAAKSDIEMKLNRLILSGGGAANDGSVEKKVNDFNIQLKANAAALGRAQPADLTTQEFDAYRKAHAKWLRQGKDMLSGDEVKAMSVGSDADGGYLVLPDTSGRIVTKVYETSPIRQIANVQTISTDALEGNEDLGEASAGWVGETQARTDTNTPQLGKWRIPVHEMYAQPAATQKLLDDASVDAEAWLAAKVADKFGRLENTAFVTGDGVMKPRGFTTYTTAATPDATRAWGVLEHVNTGQNAGFVAGATQADCLFDLINAFKPQYLGNARWVTRRSVVNLIRKFKEATTNAYIWQPGLQAGQPSQILGFPMVMAEDMPALGTNSLSLALGDFNNAYQIVDRVGIRVLRDPYTNKPYVRFYTTKRVGGGVVHFESLKFLRFGT